jgi:signal transduction histidine kinase
LKSDDIPGRPCLTLHSYLQDYMAERAPLAAALAHDLRTPITRLRLRFELLRRRKDVTVLIGDLAEIEAIIQSVIDFASHELGNESQERIDLVSLVESVCDAFPKASLEPASAGSRIVSRRHFLGGLTADPWGGKQPAFRDTECSAVW